MTEQTLIEKFTQVAKAIGAQVVPCGSAQQAAAYIGERAGGTVVLPAFATAERLQLGTLLEQAGCEVVSGDLRPAAPAAAAGVTGANFALADTGSVVLESTPEDIRLATTLPERHFVLLDPVKVLADGPAAAPVLRKFHQGSPRNYLAYISGPSRTADIERVLTIGVHGPRELHILLLEGLSDDPLEM